MANSQELGFFDKHIEKALLAIGLIILIYAVLTFGISTSRRLEVQTGGGSTELVAPEKVDESLLTATRVIERRIMTAKRPAVEGRNDAEELTKIQQNPLPGTKKCLAYGEPLSAGVVPIGGHVEGTEPPSLNEIIQAMPVPAKPESWDGNEIVYIEADIGKDVKVEEKPAWRVASWYPKDRLEAKWRGLLKNTIITPVVIPLRYEFQVEQKMPDGTWREVDTISPYRQPGPDGQVPQTPEIPAYDGRNAAEVRQAYMDYFSAGWTAYMLQPGYRNIWSEIPDATWKNHFPQNILKPFQVTPVAPSPGPAGVPRPVAPSRPRTTTPRRPGMMMEGEMGMFGDRPAPRAAPPGTMPPAPGGPAAVAQPARPEDAPLEIPEFNKQLAIGKFLFWMHAENIQYNRQYRCRFRLIFINPLLTYSSAISKRPDDAKQITVTTAWSPWSDPTIVKREVDFFVTGANPAAGKLNVSIFAQVLGQRVEYTITNVVVGQKIDATEKKQIFNPVTNQAETREVNFDTGAIAVEFNFNKRIITGIGTVKNDGVEMVYLDSAGQLRSRVMYYDKASKRYDFLEDEVRQARKKLRGDRPERPTPKETRKKTYPGRGGPEMREEFPDMMDPEMPGGRRPKRKTRKSRDIPEF